jgi:hypothetical protein
MTSIQDSLNKEELKKWFRNTLIFSLPALISFLLALQGGVDLKVAFGMYSQAVASSLIDLLQKYKQGMPQSFDIPALPKPIETTPEASTPQQ